MAGIKNRRHSALNITSEKNGRTVTAKLEGRIDTKTSPELDKSLKELLQDTDEIILDMEKIEYISSAGLRVLLSTQKQLGKKDAMKIIHANDVVMDIFEITGFSQVVTIV